MPPGKTSGNISLFQRVVKEKFHRGDKHGRCPHVHFVGETIDARLLILPDLLITLPSFPPLLYNPRNFLIQSPRGEEFQPNISRTETRSDLAPV